MSITRHEPKLLWQEFAAISNIPRCTGAEAAVLKYIEDQARERDLTVRHDSTGNMVICLPATKGCEAIPGIIVQGHVDMVCEQNMGTGHNFQKDPIHLKIDGEWLSADGTTLGADNGIAVAMMLALIKGDYAHGPLELLFTIDEEGGLIGALKLDPTILSFRKMINLDSEEEGILYIGCAGGMETVGQLPLDWEPAPVNLRRGRILLTGLGGGHSGAEIHRQPGNSLVLASRILHALPTDSVRVFNIFGGDRHNAIPREAVIEFLASETSLSSIEEMARSCERQFHGEFADEEKNLAVKIEMQEGDYPKKVLTMSCQKTLSRMLTAIPHGIIYMSRVMDGLVSTSTNFAALYIKNDDLKVLTSQRSDIRSLLDDVGNRVAAPFFLAGGSARFSREYPGWQPNPDSELLKTAQKAWREKFGNDALVTSIHAGLECGVIGSKLDKVDAISFGPDIKGAHTPDERTHIASCRRTFEFFLKLLVSVS